MPATVIIALDTAPPVLTLGLVERVSGGVRVPFEIDESAVVAAAFEALDGTITAGVLDGNAFVFEIGSAVGTVEVEAIDLVGNRAVATVVIGERGLGRLYQRGVVQHGVAVGRVVQYRIYQPRA